MNTIWSLIIAFVCLAGVMALCVISSLREKPEPPAAETPPRDDNEPAQTETQPCTDEVQTETPGPSVPRPEQAAQTDKTGNDAPAVQTVRAHKRGKRKLTDRLLKPEKTKKPALIVASIVFVSLSLASLAIGFVLSFVFLAAWEKIPDAGEYANLSKIVGIALCLVFGWIGHFLVRRYDRSSCSGGQVAGVNTLYALSCLQYYILFVIVFVIIWMITLLLDAFSSGSSHRSSEQRTVEVSDGGFTRTLTPDGTAWSDRMGTSTETWRDDVGRTWFTNDGGSSFWRE